MKKNILILAVILICFFAACTKKASPGKTIKPTTYTTDIAPLIQAKCTPCHLPSKGGFKTNFENYAGAKKYGADMLARVILNPGDKGFMPFKHEKLPAEEIALLKKWIDGGMLEN